MIVDRRIPLLKNCLFEEEPVTHVTLMLCMVKIVVGSSRVTVLSLWNSSHPPPSKSVFASMITSHDHEDTFTR